MSDETRTQLAVKALTCLDLTNLDDDCTEDDIRALAARGVTPHGSVAALCVWPRFVRLAREAAAPDIKIATVVAFPTGLETAEEAIDETEAAMRAGRAIMLRKLSIDRPGLRAGHEPGARNLPAGSLIVDGALLPVAAVRTRIDALASPSAPLEFSSG